VRSLLRFVPYVWRTIKRARLRTSLAVLGAALAMALFAFVRTVDRGVEALAEESDRPVLVVFQDSRFCPLTSYLPARYAPSIRDVEGVDEVLPTLVFINSCRANLDLVTRTAPSSASGSRNAAGCPSAAAPCSAISTCT